MATINASENNNFEVPKKSGGQLRSSFSIDSIIGKQFIEVKQPVTIDADVQIDVDTETEADIEGRLEAADLWQRFHDLGTEMIITKSGRRMFPTIRASFDCVSATSASAFGRNADAKRVGMDSRQIRDPQAKYVVALDVVPVDNKRYRYAYHKSAWLAAGKASHVPAYRYYVHPDSPFTLEQLSHTVSFEKLKVTNNLADRNGYIMLNSMHKYQPRIFVFEEKHYPVFEQFVGQMARLDAAARIDAPIGHPEIKAFVFRQLQFTAVTAYQNQLITRLKIDSNPFAKGFRDSGRLVDLERERLEQALATTQALKTGQWPIQSEADQRRSSDLGAALQLPLPLPLPFSLPMLSMSMSIQDAECVSNTDRKTSHCNVSSNADSNASFHQRLAVLLRTCLANSTVESAASIPAPALQNTVADNTWQLLMANALQALAGRQLHARTSQPTELDHWRQLQAAFLCEQIEKSQDGYPTLHLDVAHAADDETASLSMTD